jgi:hypothetical protein
MIGFIGTSFRLWSIITAHNQWLLTTRSFPYWTTSVFSSTVANAERRTPAHSHERTELTSRRTEYRLPSQTVPRLFCFIRWQWKMLTEPLSNKWSFQCLFVVSETCLPNRCLTMDFRSGSTIPAFRHHVTLCWISVINAWHHMWQNGNVHKKWPINVQSTHFPIM